MIRINFQKSEDQKSISKSDIIATLIKFKSIVILILLCAFVTVLTPKFLDANNLFNIARQTTINAIIAMGITFVILTGGIDLSVGSILAFSTTIAGSAIVKGVPIPVAVLIGLGVGAAIGFLSGVIISKLDIAPFIVTLSSMSAFRGLTLLYTNGMPISGLGEQFAVIGAGYIGVFPIPVLIMIFVFAIVWYVLNKIRFGRYIYAVGGNPEAARLSGIPVSNIKIAAYTISGLLSALSGIIIAARLNSAQPDAGVGYELDAIAAAVIGGVSISSGGKGTVVGVIVGAFVIGVLNNALNLLNISPFYQQTVKGVVILLAVILDRITSAKKK